MGKWAKDAQIILFNVSPAPKAQWGAKMSTYCDGFRPCRPARPMGGVVGRKLISLKRDVPSVLFTPQKAL